MIEKDNKLKDFIEKASEKFEGKYDYSHITKLDSTSKLKIYCPEHDIFFFQTKDKHLLMKGYPCSECERLRKQAKVIQDFISIHSDKYDYSKVRYTSKKDYVDVYCPKHDFLFPITPEKHIHRKQGCKYCGVDKVSLNNSFTQEEILKQFKDAHGDKYNYSKVIYKGVHELVEIICPVHGSFPQTPNSHKRGNGCPNCSNRDTLETMIDKLPNNFKLYDYSKAVYINSTTEITVTCNVCGIEFDQTPSALIQGHGCKVCSAKAKADKARLKPEEILSKAREIHGNKFEYGSLEGYLDNRFVWQIKCPKHSWFPQPVVSHLRGQGCKDCAKELSSSRIEKELVSYLKSLGLDVYQNYRPFWMNGEELDIFIPSLDLAIEYNGGTYHHSTPNTGIDFYEATKRPSDYHLNKFMTCKDNDVKLIHIFDFEDIKFWYDLLQDLVLNINNYEILFDNICREYYPRKSVCLKIYGKSFINKIVA